MCYMRELRWQLATTAVHAIKPELVFLLGTLARLDERLCLLDQKHAEMARAPRDAKLRDVPALLDAFGEAYLWVLGSYEAIRTLDQALREMGTTASQRWSALNALKRKFERLRVPLAKVEPARRHASTDFAFPKPGLSDEHGIAWAIAQGVWVSRAELSDEFLATFEALQNGNLTG